MCAIFAILDHQREPAIARKLALRQARLIRHRGPDWSGVYSDEHAVLAHERLAVVDVLSGAQPLRSPSGAVLAVNGEIYNHEVLRAELEDWAFQTASDCEVILPLHERHGEEFLRQLRGMFALVLYQPETGAWLIARDPIGIVPLYVGRDASGAVLVASELKALVGVCEHVEEFPPGHVQTSDDAAPRRWWTRDWFEWASIEDRPADAADVAAALDDAVRSHLMCDVPYGVLLSGGLDSSVIAALAARHARGRVEADEASEAWWPRLHSFSIGLEGSPDLAAAQVVADALDTVHHPFQFTVQEGIDALSDVIYHLETFDVTTVRAATPMYLMARRIKAMGVKMVLSGEGSDEIFGGYLYFHKAPGAQAFHEETVAKLRQLHLYDCLRANKAMAAWGIEVRVPFLDTPFVDQAMSMHARHKMCGDGRIEKHILREGFVGELPDDVLWRQKEQFSDGVGYGWIHALKEHAEHTVSDRAMASASARFPIGTPRTKEAYVYRTLFELHFPQPSAAACVPNAESVACSTPAALAWDPSFRDNADPSGRAVGVHVAASPRMVG